MLSRHSCVEESIQQRQVFINLVPGKVRDGLLIDADNGSKGLHGAMRCGELVVMGKVGELLDKLRIGGEEWTEESGFGEMNGEANGGSCRGELAEGCSNGVDWAREVDVIDNGNGGEAKVLSGGDEDGLEGKTEEEGAKNTPLTRTTF